MSVFPRVLFDESHSNAWTLSGDEAARINPAQPADASYALAAAALRHRGFAVAPYTEGAFTPDLPGDVLVVAHPARVGSERASGTGEPELTEAEIDAVESFVRAGGGLVVLGECDQDKYGNNLNDLLARFGLHIDSLTCHDGTHRHEKVSSWVLADVSTGAGQGLLAGVNDVCFYRAGAISFRPEAAAADVADARVVARTSAAAHPASAPLAVVTRAGAGRVVVLADSDLFGDDSIDELDHRALWVNLVTWAAGAGAARGVDTPGAHLADDPRWLDLKAAVEELRPLQAKDGSIDTAQHDAVHARALVERIVAGIAALAPEFEHDAAYLAQLQADFERWASEGFGVPDFLDSLMLFRPEASRADGVCHLVVFPMYTQNGNPNRQVEAVLCSVLWPQWLADVEGRYDNPAFLSFNFIDFTPGYDTNSAVLFPETVAVREVPAFTWGAIFSDREAARFRAVTAAAADLLKLDLPPDAERLVTGQELAQSVFAMWDLIHDRTHSHGDLPFDPFMIKQRMPFWLYALEELRCDLNTFRQAVELEAEGQPYAKAVQYAIVFDRIFRFTITGDRVRNYDGLGGQLLFAYLHRHDALRWTDNSLSFDWSRVPGAVIALADEVERLYRDGIDRSKVGHWIASYEFVSSYVRPNPRSTWAKGPDALPLDGPPKGLVDVVEDDEFPLNVFFEALRKKLAPVIASTAGITGRSAAAASPAPAAGEKVSA